MISFKIYQSDDGERTCRMSLVSGKVELLPMGQLT